MAHHVYILYSKTKDRFYIGSTSDVNERLKRHNAGATKSTKAGRPWKIVYFEEYNTKTEAIKREIFLKRMKSKKLIESLIQKGSSAGYPSERSHPGGERPDYEIGKV